MKRNIVSIGIVILILFLFNITQAFVWYVHPDSTQNCIQDCLDACTTGDTVLVGPGMYIENIIWPYTQGIDLISEYGPDTTIIDGDNQGTVLSFDTGVDTTTVIRGFTIKNGYAYSGGGIYADSSSPTIIQNIFVNNTAWHRGGAIDFVGPSVPVIKQNIIMNNYSVWGGGIHIMDLCDAWITENVVTLNVSDSGGGGMLISYDSDPTISYNTINNNTSYWGGGGIGFFNSFLGGTLRNNIIANNIATEFGGGVACSVATVVIESCAIVNNNRDGIYCGGYQLTTIHYNNFVNNSGFSIRNNSTSSIINAEYNWWGDSSGPFHPDSNPGGLGDTVSDYVDFDPWLQLPAVGLFEQNRPVVKHTPIQTTIVRGVINLQSETFNPQSKVTLLDITGRKVAELKSGANNIRHLAPGVYFIRSNNNNLVTKIIVTR